MSEQEKFLERWSRRKREAEEREPDPRSGEQSPSARPRESGDPAVQNERVEGAALDSRLRGNEREIKENKEAEVDLSSLPPLDSIVANSDIRAFLRPGVPAGLTRAALRRAWAADPAIRDFIGLSENSWDFTAPGGVPGFGPLDPAEVPRLLAEVFGPETREKVQSALETVECVADRGNPAGSAEASAVATIPASDVKAEPPIPATQPNKKVLSQRTDDDVAVQNNSPQTEERVAQARRGHGGALPE